MSYVVVEEAVLRHIVKKEEAPYWIAVGEEVPSHIVVGEVIDYAVVGGILDYIVVGERVLGYSAVAKN